MELFYLAKTEDDGRELKNILRCNMQFSMTAVRRMKLTSGIFVNGNPEYTNYKVSAGDLVRVEYSENAPEIPPEKGELDIVYEDQWYLVVNKPRGMFTHPSHSRFTGTLMNFALHYVMERGDKACHAVNRLDRDTSGLVLFARSGFAKALCSSIAIDKEYSALVWGRPEQEEAVIELPIKREKERDMRRIIAPGGARAVTRYRVEKAFDGFSLLRLALVTGRTHQIRVHCLALGHPVLGDRLYSTPQSLELAEKLKIEPHMLHAASLSFTHPMTGAALKIDCPPDWRILE